MQKKNTPTIRFKGFTDPWEQRKLGEVCEELSYGVGAAAVPFDGQTRYLRITDIDDETHEFMQDDLSSPDPDFALSDNDYLKSGDIVFARTGASVGKTYLNRGKEEDIVFAGFLIRAVLQSSFDPEFIYQQTLSEAYKNFVAISSQRSGQPGINAQEYSNWDLWVCDDKEQVKIGSFFRKLDDLITLHQRKLEMMKNFKKSMLEKMFPKNGSNVPEIRFAGFTDPWEQRKLGEVAAFGKGVGHSKSDIKESGTPFLHYGRLYTNYETAIRSVDTFADQNHGDLLSIGGEVVTPSSGETAEDIAVASAVLSPGILLGGGLNVVYPGDRLDSVFTALSISWGRQHYDLASKAQGKSVVHLYNDDLAESLIVAPTVEEQSRIGSLFLKLDDLITLHQRKLDRLKDLKRSMLEKMFA